MRRRPDTPYGQLPGEIQPGDFWKIAGMKSDDPGNLTGECWRVAIPMSYGFALATLTKHTVREHEDGEISVKPNDGSSNSILVTGHHGEQWHGYIDHDVLQEA